MKVLILGSGGREHALAWKISQSPLLTELFIAPGNAGTLELGTNIDISPTDFPAVEAFVLETGIEMVVVGPEVPLVAGIYDYFTESKKLKNIPLIGPSKLGAALEGSSGQPAGLGDPGAAHRLAAPGGPGGRRGPDRGH